jgi:hypothetical protein
MANKKRPIPRELEIIQVLKAVMILPDKKNRNLSTGYFLG